ncbi:MAG: hypothetical protein J0M12_02595 [Deltaproteobacteria bacterium]|nr:hypothetical protein [Deltaproteobacteria bacterium]
MLKIPRVAVFKPNEEDAAAISALFQRHEYSVRMVSNVAEIALLIQDEDATFDCVIIPPRMEGGAGGVNLCLQLKTHELLASVPILALVQSKDRALLQSLYGAGVDVVLLAPFDADMLFHQIGSLSRTKRAFDELVQQHYEDSGMRHSSISAFNSIREGLIICDRDYAVTFINSPGATLLGVKKTHAMEHIENAVKQFAVLMQRHEELMRQAIQETAGAADISSFSLLIHRLDNRSFKAEARVATLLGKHGQTVGFSIAFSDMSGILQLSQLLTQAQRTRALSLLTSAGCLKLLSGRMSAIEPPLHVLDQILGEERPHSSLATSITFLLEILDQIIASGIEVKVKVRQDWMVAVRPSDLFQMLGHLTMLAAENAVLGGEIVLDAEENRSAGYVEVVVTSRAETRIRYLHDDLVSLIIEGSLAHTKELDSKNQKISDGFNAAQNIAARYGSKVEFRRISEAETRSSIFLPLARVAD